MKYIFLTLTMFAVSFLGNSQDKPAYLIYQNGKVVQWSDLVQSAAQYDIVLFGEFHNNPVCHWLQYELTKDLFALKEGKIILGAEMFE